MIATTIFSKRLAACATALTKTALRGLSGAACALGLAAMLPILAHAGPAPKMCIPAATGVAGQSGPPDWITPGQTATDSYQPTDPRWRGSLALDFAFGSATTAHESDVEFRALSDPGKTYFVGSWFIETAPDIVRNQTTLWLGLSPNASAKGLIVQITLSDTSTGIDDAWMPASASESAFTVSAFQSDGAGHWTQMATPPPWIATSTRVWINTAGTDGSTKTRWAVEMKVPFGDPSVAITDTNSFLMWHDAQIDYVYGGGAASALIPYTWPRSTSANVLAFVYHMDTSSFPATAVYPATSNWGEFSLADPATAGCAGISLATTDIGTTNAGSQSRMSLTTPNTFFAKPSSTQNTPVPSGVLSATFRIANWGSQVGDTTATSWQSPPTLTDVVDGAGIAAWSGAPPAPHGDIEGTWTLSAAERCPFTGQVGVTDEDGNFTPGSPACPNVNPTSELHQCMLVELKGPGQNFLSSSAFRNMDFVHASTFSRQAEISVVGLPPTPAHQRDVYLYVEHENMPAVVTTSTSSSGGQTGAGGGQTGGGGVVAGRPGFRAVSMGGETVVDTSTMPTYIVHAYHDTGIKVSIAGKERIVLLPQTSYGYYVTHEGPLNGWSDSVQGAQPLSEVDHYKVGVPDNGSVHITNTIEAVELSRWAAWLALGATIPHGGFSNDHDGGFVGTLGLEYAINPQLSVEATLAAHHFDGKGGADAIDVTAFGVDAKFYMTPAPLRWFVDGGIGLYAFDPGSTRFGGTIGGGAQYALGHGWAIEGRYNLQSVTSNAPNTSWSTLQVAVRKAF